MLFFFPPEILKPSPLPEMASVIDCVGGAGWVGFIVIINKTASREPQGIGLGKEDHSELCEQTRSLAATEAGLWVSLKGFRGWAG